MIGLLTNILPLYHVYFKNLPVEVNTRLQAAFSRVHNDDDGDSIMYNE